MTAVKQNYGEKVLIQVSYHSQHFNSNRAGSELYVIMFSTTLMSFPVWRFCKSQCIWASVKIQLKPSRFQWWYTGNDVVNALSFSFSINTVFLNSELSSIAGYSICGTSWDSFCFEISWWNPCWPDFLVPGRWRGEAEAPYELFISFLCSSDKFNQERSHILFTYLMVWLYSLISLTWFICMPSCTFLILVCVCAYFFLFLCTIKRQHRCIPVSFIYSFTLFCPLNFEGWNWYSRAYCSWNVKTGINFLSLSFNFSLAKP